MAKSKHFGALAAAAGALMAVTLLVLMLVLVNPQPAGAAFPGANGVIAYSHWDGNDWEILAQRESVPIGDVGLILHVTRNNMDDRWPDYSPDGSRIVFSHWDGNDSEIYTIASSATKPIPVQITNNTTNDTWPTYASRDGSRIAYVGWDGNDREIYTIAATPGSTPVRVTNNFRDDYRPSYTIGGDAIAYDSYDGNDYEIYTIAATGGTPLRATNNTRDDTQPDYCCGDRIYYSHWDGNDWEIYRVQRPSSSTGTNTGVPVTNNTIPDHSPVSSPDGTRFVYSSWDGHDFEIYTRHYSGGTPVQVTKNDRNDYDPYWQPRSGPLSKLLPINVPKPPWLGSHSSTR